MLIEDLIPTVAPNVRGAPEPLIERKLREAARKFFRASMVWRITVDVPIVNGTAAYTPVLPTDAIITDVIYAKVINANRNLVYTRDAAKAYVTPNNMSTGPTEAISRKGLTEVELYPTPDQALDGDTLRLRLALNIPRDATTIDDDMAEEFEHVLVSGALAELYDIPNQRWSNANKAAKHSSMFYGGIEGAKLRAQEAQTPGVRTVAYGGIP